MSLEDLQARFGAPLLDLSGCSPQGGHSTAGFHPQAARGGLHPHPMVGTSHPACNYTRIAGGFSLPASLIATLGAGVNTFIYNCFTLQRYFGEERK